MTGISIVAIGTVYSTIFRLPVGDLLPFIAVGMVTWTWMSTTLAEACGAFNAYKFIMNNHVVRPSSIVVRVVVRNAFVLGHNALVIIILFAIFGRPVKSSTLMALPGVILLGGVIFTTAVILAYACSRYRDLTQIVTSALGLLFLVTPILWSPEVLGERGYIAQVNPFTHLVDLVRQPLLGSSASATNWAVASTLFAVSSTMAWATDRQFRKRVLFWL